MLASPLSGTRARRQTSNGNETSTSGSRVQSEYSLWRIVNRGTASRETQRHPERTHGRRVNVTVSNPASDDFVTRVFRAQRSVRRPPISTSWPAQPPQRSHRRELGTAGKVCIYSLAQADVIVVVKGSSQPRCHRSGRFACAAQNAPIPAARTRPVTRITTHLSGRDRRSDAVQITGSTSPPLSTLVEREELGLVRHTVAVRFGHRSDCQRPFTTAHHRQI